VAQLGSRRPSCKCGCAALPRSMQQNSAWNRIRRTGELVAQASGGGGGGGGGGVIVRGGGARLEGLANATRWARARAHEGAAGRITSIVPESFCAKVT
jgi:hypothetical protein